MTEKELEQNVLINGVNVLMMNAFMLELSDIFFNYVKKKDGQKMSDEIQRDLHFRLYERLKAWQISSLPFPDNSGVWQNALKERLKEIADQLDQLNDRIDRL